MCNLCLVVIPFTRPFVFQRQHFCYTSYPRLVTIGFVLGGEKGVVGCGVWWVVEFLLNGSRTVSYPRLTVYLRNSFSFRVQHLHEQRLRGRAAVAMFVVQVLLSSRRQIMNLRQQLDHFLELILNIRIACDCEF